VSATATEKLKGSCDSDSREIEGHSKQNSIKKKSVKEIAVPLEAFEHRS
jgi:hypothetical protein